MDGYLPEKASISFCGASAAAFSALVPSTAKTMENGLQGFPALGPRDGMLFVSTSALREQKIPMWMAKVHFSLDLVWLGADGRVVAIEREVQPGDKRTFSHSGLACIEIRGGSCRALGIRIGTPWVYGRTC